MFLFPCFLGHASAGDGWWAQLNENGAAKSRGFGRYLGNRYRRFKNIIWTHGGDRSPAAGSAGESYAIEMLLGIKETDPEKLHTYHGARFTTSVDQERFAPYMDLDAVYPGDELSTQKKVTGADAYMGSLRSYNREKPRPHFLIEARYESVLGKGPAGAYTKDRGLLRRQAYWTNLSGATGHFYGNWPVWDFSAGWDGPAGIFSPGSQDMVHLREVFVARAWHMLVPDQTHTTVVAGYGTYGQTDYVTAGRAVDGSLVMAYVPPTGVETRKITVDMSRLRGPATVRWFNPANGSYTNAAGAPFSNTGSRDFTTPGENGAGTNDWVLVLEALGPAR